ncbi:hypothetical protein FKM82_013803 [Ascaphus truei]
MLKSNLDAWQQYTKGHAFNTGITCYSKVKKIWGGGPLPAAEKRVNLPPVEGMNLLHPCNMASICKSQCVAAPSDAQGVTATYCRTTMTATKEGGPWLRVVTKIKKNRSSQLGPLNPGRGKGDLTL